jgi:hypothetical protein
VLYLQVLACLLLVQQQQQQLSRAMPHLAASKAAPGSRQASKSGPWATSCCSSSRPAGIALGLVTQQQQQLLLLLHYQLLLLFHQGVQ